jgi:hypothetical protein
LSGADLGKGDSLTLYREGIGEIRLHEVSRAVGRLNSGGANLEGATGVSLEELEKQAKSLKGATMPDGKIHS